MAEKLAVRKSPTAVSPPVATDPFAEMDRLFSEFRDDWLSTFWPTLPTTFLGRPELSGGSFLPALADVEDSGKSYEIRVDIPGVPKNQIDVRVHGDVVEIRAEAGTSREEKGKSYLRRERTYQGFQRAIRLPEPVLGEKVEARYENGILTVSVPKVHPAEERKVPVA